MCEAAVTLARIEAKALASSLFPCGRKADIAIAARNVR
jgi:hypothetical protein